MLKIENVYKTFTAGTVNEKKALRGLMRSFFIWFMTVISPAILSLIAQLHILPIFMRNRSLWKNDMLM